MTKQRNGKPFWRTLWTGDAMVGGSEDTWKSLVGSRRETLAEAKRGVTYPVTLWLGITIGVWLTFTRVSVANSAAVANSEHLMGVLMITFSLTALAGVACAVLSQRRLRRPADRGTLAARRSGLAAGTVERRDPWRAADRLALRRGGIKATYAGWNRHVF